jgi:hypothetical protein
MASTIFMYHEKSRVRQFFQCDDENAAENMREKRSFMSRHNGVTYHALPKETGKKAETKIGQL